MAAEGPADGKPPKSAKAPPKKRASAAAAKPAGSRSAATKSAKTARPAAGKPAKGRSAAVTKAAKTVPAGAPSKAAKAASAAATKRAKTVRATKPPSTAARKPAKSAPASKPARAPSAAATQRAKTASAGAVKPAKAASAAAKKPRGTSAAPAKPAAAPAPPATERQTPSSAPLDATPASTPAEPTRVEATARSYFDALAARDAGAAALAWDQNGVNDIVPVGIFRGPEAIRAFFEELFTAVPDVRFTVERIIADEEAASVQWRAAGTFSGGSFQGLEPNGRRVDLRGNDCLEIEDGKIMHNTGVFDGAAFARQVGLLPAEDSGADRAIRAGFNTVTKLRRTIARRSAR